MERILLESMIVSVSQYNTKQYVHSNIQGLSRHALGWREQGVGKFCLEQTYQFVLLTCMFLVLGSRLLETEP